MFNRLALQAARVTVARRTIAAAAPAQSRLMSTRTPPQLWGFSGKTASALFEAAQQSNSAEKVFTELQAFQSAYAESYELRALLLNPLLKGDKRLEVLSALFPEVGVTSDLSKELIVSLVNTRSTPKLKKVIADFEKLVSYARNEVQASVVTADALTPAQVQKLTAALQARLDKGEKLVLSQKVDPSILGGLKVYLGNQSIDLSVLTRVRSIDRALRSGE